MARRVARARSRVTRDEGRGPSGRDRATVRRMIVTRSESWLPFVFAAQGTTLSRIWRRLTVNVGFAVAVTIGHVQLGLLENIDVTPLPFTLIGFVLSIFLGFRINTAYERLLKSDVKYRFVIDCARF